MASTRRHFLHASAVAATAAPAALARQGKSANDKIQFATIGIGGMGTGDTETAVKTPGTKLVGVCDVYQGRLTRAREVWGAELFTTRDYREVLQRKDVDAVLIATPDHWHAAMAIDALEAGKDVYVQKPMVQRWQDGHKVIEAAKRPGRIVQVGSQRVSSVVYAKAREIFRSGALGELNMVEAWWDRNSALGAWQYSIPQDANPATVDWDRFLGAAPRRPFEPVRLFRWRNYQDYGTGVAGDLFVHLFSGMHFVTGAIGPERVFGSGGLRFWKDGRDVPDILLGLYDYPKTSAHPAFNLALRVNFVNGAGESSGFKFTGSDAVMTIGNGVSLTKLPPERDPGTSAGNFDAATQRLIMAEHLRKYPPVKQTAASLTAFGEERWLAPRGYSDEADHHANFFEAVRTRKPVVEDAVFGLRAAAPALLTNESYHAGKTVSWDAEKMQVKG
ncbi:MAG: Gfo/Idh/MocA family oxidoreductase [Candidatus Solibacter usitatus]|nr:Gfo/Idh/MocA family oxidoreductase [Candidatus Solibacter usitatus]